MTVLMEAGAVDAVTTAIQGLGTQVGTLVPIALGVAITPFAARWLFKKAKGLMG